ncbi:MAG: FMN-binding protein [Treponema sp.]|nr:FMN-binding protein [Treponema sp.]
MLSMIKLGLILAVFASVSCLVLALVNNVTAPKIKQNQIEKINSAMREFFPGEGYTFEEVKDFSPASKGTIKIESLYLAKKNGIVEGGAVQVSGPTYDTATIFAGVKKDGSIQGIKFLKLTDSPGFGLKANDSSYTLSKSKKTFYGQFEGMNASDGFTVNKTFEAISGATITSAGIGALLEEGCNCLLKEFAK